jgi:hypothetical protein
LRRRAAASSLARVRRALHPQRRGIIGRDWQMSADGTWKLSMKTPIGERKSTLALQSSGATLAGKLTSEEGNSTDIFDGKVSGDSVSFKANIKSPMPLTLEFSGSLSGNKISGTVTASGVGSWPFSGDRA